MCVISIIEDTMPDEIKPLPQPKAILFDVSPEITINTKPAIISRKIINSKNEFQFNNVLSFSLSFIIN